MWTGILFLIILTGLWTSIRVTRSYSSRPLLCALVTHHPSPSSKTSLFQGPLTSAGLGTRYNPSFLFKFCLPALESKIYPTKTRDRKAECVACCTHTLIWHRVHQEIQEQLETQAKTECRWILPYPHTTIFYSTSHSSAQSFHAVVAVFSTSCCMHIEQGTTLILTLLVLGPSWT